MCHLICNQLIIQLSTASILPKYPRQFLDSASACIQRHKQLFIESHYQLQTLPLYHSGVDEQLVMECTGHHSVYCYKRTLAQSGRHYRAFWFYPRLQEALRNVPAYNQQFLNQQWYLPATTQLSFLNTTSSSQLSTLSAATRIQQSLHSFSFPSATFYRCNITFNVRFYALVWMKV